MQAACDRLTTASGRPPTACQHLATLNASDELPSRPPNTTRRKGKARRNESCALQDPCRR
jgi:hypothetical protein